MSMLFSPPRCTPPMPPVAKTRMPARLARIIVVATVVAPVSFPATTIGRSLRLTLSTPFASHMRTSSSSVRPAFSRPSMTAMVAGTAPSARMIFSTSRAKSRFCGYGMPWLRIVLSSATTGFPSATA